MANDKIFDSFVLLFVLGFGSLSLVKSECIKDIVLVLDTSKSITGAAFDNHVKPFLRNLVTDPKLNVRKDGTRVGLVTFSSVTKSKKFLEIGQIFDADKLGRYVIFNLQWYDVAGAHTRTDLGLEIANEMFKNFTKKNAENHRGNYSDVAIVITDGEHWGRPGKNDKQEAMKWAKELKGQGVLIIGAAVGPKAVKHEYIEFINELAESPEYVIAQEDLKDIDNFLLKLMDATCNGTLNVSSGSRSSQLHMIILTSVGASAGVSLSIVLIVLLVIRKYKRRRKASKVPKPVASIPSDTIQSQNGSVAGPSHNQTMPAQEGTGYENVNFNTLESYRKGPTTDNGIGQIIVQRESDYVIPQVTIPIPYDVVQVTTPSVYAELNKQHRRETNGGLYQHLLKHDSGYVIPADGETEQYEEVQMTTPSGYAELNKQDRRETNDGTYQQLLKHNTGYVIPADGETRECKEIRV